MAQQSSEPVTPVMAALPSDDLLRAEVLVSTNRTAQAREILERLEQDPQLQPGRASQIQFLLGLLDMGDKNYDSAIARFRRILVAEPNAVRVRLEMGRALYSAGRLPEAERQFMYARAGRVPATVRINIDRYLGLIRQRKRLSYGFSIAIAPDSNLNAGPATSAITLYGLPFELSPTAKANSGVGLMLDGNIEWAPPVGRRVHWRTGILWHRSQYRDTTFDDMTATLYTGPHISVKRWDFNILANVSRRWYGDRGYSRSFGPSVDATYYVTPRFGVGVSGNLNQTRYDLNKAQNGRGGSVTVSTFYTPTTSSFVRGAATVGRQDAALPAYAYRSLQLGITYVREFPGGITASASPTLTSLRYDAELAAFGIRRVDRQYGVQVSLLHRRIDFHGLTPRIAYTFIKNDSNIGLYTFKRSRIELGFTSAF